MDKNKFISHLLCALAVTAVMMTFFPVAVMFEAFGMERFVFRDFCAVYLVWGAFFAFGYQSEKLGCHVENKVSEKIKPFLFFVTRITVILPAAVFVLIAVLGKLQPAVYVYVLTASVGAFVGGYMTYGKAYTDIYRMGWFVLFVIFSVFAAMLFVLSKNEALHKTGITFLCVGFGTLIVIAAVLANQTNIDVCTRQRASSNQVLPSGLRRYNALLIIGVCAVLIGLFVFAKPLGSLLRFVFTMAARGISHLFNDVCVGKPQEIVEAPDTDSDSGGGEIQFPEEYEDYSGIVFAVVIAIVAVILIVLRRQIVNFIKTALTPMSKSDGGDVPFVDEVTTSDRRSATPRGRRKAERALLKKYRRASDPGNKYRLGYALFLLRLSGTDRAAKPSDTARIQRKKGEEQYNTDLGRFSEVYGKLRYGDIIPSSDEIVYEEELLDKLK